MNNVAKRLAAASLAVLLAVICFPVQSAMGEDNNKLALSFDECEDKASAGTGIIKLENSISSMERLQDELEEVEDGVYSNIDIYNTLSPEEEYNIDLKNSMEEKIKNGETLTSEEQAAYDRAVFELNALYAAKAAIAALGMDPEDLSKEQEFIHIIKPIRFQMLELEVGIKNAKLNMDSVKNASKCAVRGLYDNILYVEGSTLLQQQLCSIYKNKYNIVCEKLKNGQASEMDRFSAECGLKKSALTLNSLGRNADNLSLSLKRQIGVGLKQQLEILPYESGDIKAPASYDEYLKKGLSKRYEVISAVNNLGVKQEELEITEDYMGKSSPEYIQAFNSETECQYELQQSINTVTRDIKLGYADMLKKQRAVESALKKKDGAKSRYDEFKLRYGMGGISESMLLDVQMAYIQADLSYNKAVMDYNTSIYRLNTASGIGPGYNAGEGES